MPDQPTPTTDQPRSEPTAEEIEAAMPFLIRLVQIGADVDARMAREAAEADQAKQEQVA